MAGGFAGDAAAHRPLPSAGCKHGSIVVSAVLLTAALTGGSTQAAGRTDLRQPGGQRAQTKIDELVFARLKQLNIEPASICTDGVFVRRVFLDVIGTLPTAEEAAEFLKDPDPNKRGN